MLKFELTNDHDNSAESIQTMPENNHIESCMRIEFEPVADCSSSVLDPNSAESIAKWGRAAFEWTDSCGIKAMGGPFILQDGKLTETLEWGLHEVSFPTIYQALLTASVNQFEPTGHKPPESTTV